MRLGSIKGKTRTERIINDIRSSGRTACFPFTTY
jgi:hypothetical protein